MYTNILVPVMMDHAHDYGTALDIARRLRKDGGTITMLHVIDDVPVYAAQYLPEGHLKDRKDEVLTAMKADLGGVKDVHPVVVSGHSGRTILDYAEAQEVDCIVIASHRPGMQDYFLGSTAARVVRHAACSVHVIR